MQIFERYQCSVKRVGNKLDFHFVRGGIPDGGMENPQNFKKNDLLFSLMKIVIGEKTKYLFSPGVYKIELFSNKSKNKPIYFLK